LYYLMWALQDVHLFSLMYSLLLLHSVREDTMLQIEYWRTYSSFK